MIHLPITIASVRDLHVAYSIDKMVNATDWEAIYVGHCRLDELPDLPDARANTAFRDMVEPNDQLRLTIICIDPSKHVCDVWTWTPRKTAVCNQIGTQLEKAGSRRVRCVEDGLEFDNASKAAKHYNISASSLYNHLNKRPSFKTVGGRRFVRI